MANIQKVNTSLDERIKEPEFRDLVQQQHVIVGDRVTGYLTKNFSFVERYFTKKELVKLVNDAKLKEAKTETDFRHKCLQLATDFQFKALEEKYDNWLRVIKVEFKSHFIDFVQEREQQLRKNVKEREAVFFSDMRDRYNLYEQNKDMPTLAARYLQYIQNEETKYFDWIEQQLDILREIVDENVLELKN
jgi:signal transduction protein with GAF and PtsI domain